MAAVILSPGSALLPLPTIVVISYILTLSIVCFILQFLMCQCFCVLFLLEDSSSGKLHRID
jgi:uncharacterized Tic20 family protein